MLTTRKLALLAALAVQNALLVGLMASYQRRQGAAPMVPSSVMVCWVEIAKLVLCAVMELSQNPGLLMRIHHDLSNDVGGVLFLAIPAALYSVQNNLCYVALRSLSPLVYQVLYQSKVLTTAFFAVAMLGKRLRPQHWTALAMLTAGLILVQLSRQPQGSGGPLPTESLTGLLSLGTAAVTSGFAGVFFELMLKHHHQKTQATMAMKRRRSLWLQSLYLGAFALPMSLWLARVHLCDGLKFPDAFAWRLIVLQAASGILVGLCIRHLDNILKTFATGASIVLSALLHPQPPALNLQVIVGTLFVLLAVYLYGRAEFFSVPIIIEEKDKLVEKLRRVESNRTLTGSD
jgi:UDP-sugar transporter A1/2/3